jgi:hypothetical protein
VPADEPAHRQATLSAQLVLVMSLADSRGVRGMRHSNLLESKFQDCGERTQWAQKLPIARSHGGERLCAVYLFQLSTAPVITELLQKQTSHLF